MKYRTEIRDRTVPHTIDGTTHSVPTRVTVRTPVIPRDWDQVAIRVAYGLVLALTLLSIVWSTVSIGQLLGGGVGFAAAVVFDLAWLVNVLLEWLSRFDPAKRAFSKRLGWALLVATMGAILWHGLLAGNPALAVVGAAVSAFAKLLWLGIMRFIDRELSPADAAWVQAEISRANAQLAVASVRRQVAQAEDRAAAVLLATEQARAEFAELLHQTSSEDTEHESADTVSGQPDRADATVRSAVRAARDTMPSATPADIAAQLTGLGITVTPDTVRRLSGQDADTTDTTDSSSAQPETTIADTVRTALASGVRDPDKVLSAVRAVHGQHVVKDTVTRTLRRYA